MDNEQVMKHPSAVTSVRVAARAAALTSLSGLLQEVQQDGGCLLHTQLLCVLTPGLWRGKSAANSALRLLRAHLYQL